MTQTPPPYKAPNLQEPEYEERSLLRKLMPAIVMLSGVAVFVFAHFIANSKTDLLSGQFLMGTPFFLGAWIAYFSGYKRPTTLGSISSTIFVLMVIILLISIPFLKEGIICLVMASPILFLFMWIGAICMHLFCKKIWKSKALHGFAFLPLLVLYAPLAQQAENYQQTASIVINATPEQIWQSVNHVEQVESESFYQSSKLLPFMGVPTPKSAITVMENGKPVRKCQWYGDIYFDEPIISQVPNQQLTWAFQFYEDSVPRGTLDDHVTINGEHFKLLTAKYDIQPINPTQSKLTLTVNYQINTNINGYASLWGKWVMSEFSEDILRFYKGQLERQV